MHLDSFRRAFSNNCIHTTRSGKFLFGSNRDLRSLAGYKINEATGLLTSNSHTLVEGETPRTFCIDPTDQYLLIANMDSDAITSFHIDKPIGALTHVGTALPCLCQLVLSSKARIIEALTHHF